MKTHNNFILSERFFWFISAGVIILFFILNRFTPLTVDDYALSLGIDSVADIVKSQYNQWFGWGGRSIAHFFAQFWLLAGKPIFNIANTFAYCAFILLTAFHITGKAAKINPALFLIINTFYWFIVPTWGQNFLWLDGSCNYLWTTTIILFFLVPFRKRHDTKDYKLNMPLSVLFFIAGILAGWSNENSTAAILFLLIAYFVMKIINKDKIALFEIIGSIGFLIGFIMLIAAPGNYVRADVTRDMGGGHSNETLIIMLLKRFIDVTFMFFRNHGLTVMAAAILLGFDLLYHQKRRLNLFSYFYALAAIASAYSMLLSPVFPDRAFLIVIVFAGITLGTVLMQFETQVPAIIKRNVYFIIVVMLLSSSVSFLKAGRNITSIYLRWQNRVEYIIAQRDSGNLDVEVKAPIPVTDSHAALHGLIDLAEDQTFWFNASLAEYFGLKSIKKSDDESPWESLW